MREPTLDEISTVSQRLAPFGPFIFSLAGSGEPFMRHDLIDIVALLAKHHFVSLTTNGWFVTPRKARDIFKAGLRGIGVSIDYITPEKHDAQRGVDGAFARAVQALDYLSKGRINKHQRVIIMTVLHNDNIDEIEPLIRLAAKHDAFFQTQLYSPIKSGDKNFVIAEKVSRYLLSLKKKYKNFASNPYFLSQFDSFLKDGISGCRAGKSFFNINTFCQASLCVEMCKKPVGNLLTDPISDIFIAMQQEYKKNVCRECWYNCRGEIEALYSLRGLYHAFIYSKT